MFPSTHPLPRGTPLFVRYLTAVLLTSGGQYHPAWSSMFLLLPGPVVAHHHSKTSSLLFFSTDSFPLSSPHPRPNHQRFDGTVGFLSTDIRLLPFFVVRSYGPGTDLRSSHSLPEKTNPVANTRTRTITTILPVPVFNISTYLLSHVCWRVHHHTFVLA